MSSAGAPPNAGAAGLAPSPTRHRLLATLALVGVTAVWGGTFVVVRDAVAQMPVLPFLAWRFVLAFLALVALRPRAVANLRPDKRRHGVLLGLILGSAYLLQTYGLQQTSATISGFVTGMFVVFTPLIGLVLLRQAVRPTVWLGVALATAGLGLISLDGVSAGVGEALTLGCAVLFAGHIVGLGQWSTRSDAYGLTVLQLGVVAVTCLGASVATGALTGAPNAGLWAAIVFMAIVATALAFLAQTWAQTHMSAPRAAIVLTLEPVFAGVFGVTVGGDPLTGRILAGGACIVAAMYVVELSPLQGARPRARARARARDGAPSR